MDSIWPFKPSLSVTFLARYAWDVSAGEFAAQVDGCWNDDQFVEATNSQLSFENSYMLWNARLSYTPAAGDEMYRLYNLDLGLLGIAEEVYAPPRWWGVTVRYSF